MAAEIEDLANVLPKEQDSALRGLIGYLTHELGVKPEAIYSEANISNTAYNNYMRNKSRRHGPILKPHVLRLADKRKDGFYEWAKSLIYIVSGDNFMASRSDLLANAILGGVKIDKEDISNFAEAYVGVYKIYRYAAHLDQDYYVPDPETRLSDLIKDAVGTKSPLAWTEADLLALADWSNQSVKHVIHGEREKINAQVVVSMMQIVNEGALPGFTLYYRRSNSEKISRTEGVIVPLGEAVYFFSREGYGGYPLVHVTAREKEKSNLLEGMVLRRQDKSHAVFASRMVMKRLSIDTITVANHDEVKLYSENEISEDISTLINKLYNDVKLYGKATLTSNI